MASKDLCIERRQQVKLKIEDGEIVTSKTELLREVEKFNEQ